MDHLPTPKNVVTNERTIVPYVCLKEYDGGPFLTYPARESIAHAVPSGGNILGGSPYQQHERTHPTPKREQEDFLQRWLFFGLVHEILGDRYKPGDLISTTQADNGETTIVSTVGLVEALDKWIADIHAGFVNHSLTYDHIIECLHLTFNTLFGAGLDFDLRIKVSLASLGELFALAVNEAYTGMDKKYPEVPFHALIDHAYWEKPMLLSGWCPSQVNVNTNSSIYLQALYFLTSLGQPASSASHRSCNNDQCLAFQNDLTTYQTKHAGDCNCKQFSIDTKRLTEILESGSLPLLRIQEGHTLNELSVELVPSEATSCYIALSHVWSDGLGNPHENALPRCQLYSLHHIINKYYAKLKPQAVEGVLLWCDTLCCPVEPGRAKNIALTKMKKTYVEALRVLVLDASLRMYDFKTMDAEEACIRVLNSGWTRRLWTLQEGALAARNDRLSFLFRDEAINIRHLLGMMYKASQSSIGRKGLAVHIIIEIAKFNNEHSAIGRDQGGDLGSVEAGLRYRSVSVPSDEPLVIANLLDLDVAYILNGPCPLAGCANVGCDHSRVHRMWLLMPTTSRGIHSHVLLRVGPRLSERGFRWAPSTLLHYESSNPELYPGNIKIDDPPTSSGLIFGSQNVVLSMLLKLALVLMSTIRNPLAKLGFPIRAGLGPVGWIRGMIGNLKRTSLVRNQDPSRGMVTSRGLLVRFAGYRLWMAHCKPDILPDSWNLSENKWLYARGIDGTWYFIGCRPPAERESFLSPKSLRTILHGEGDLWITHVESGLRASSLGNEKRSTMGLLVQLLSEEKGMKYVESKLHVNISLLGQSKRDLYETAYQSAKEVSRNLPAGLLAATPTGEAKEGHAGHPPDNQAALELLEQEVKGIGMQNASQDVIATAAELSKDGGPFFLRSLIIMMIAGSYGCVGKRTADGQEWCFD